MEIPVKSLATVMAVFESSLSGKVMDLLVTRVSHNS